MRNSHRHLTSLMRSGVLKVTSIKMAVLRNAAPCSLILTDVSGELTDDGAGRSSATQVSVYQSTQCSIPEDSHVPRLSQLLSCHHFFNAGFSLIAVHFSVGPVPGAVFISAIARRTPPLGARTLCLYPFSLYAVLFTAVSSTSHLLH